MLDMTSIFQYKIPSRDKLQQNGFVFLNDRYQKSVPVMGGQFSMQVSVTTDGMVDYHVFDADTGEEYILVHVESATGSFIGDMRIACEKVLREIAEQCFDTDVFRAEQTRRVINHIRTTYGTEPEFLWEKSPDSAVFRIKENEKWFAIIMSVDRSKIIPSEHGHVEVIDLKDAPELVEKRMDNMHFFKAYHMNKKHWYTICLDGSISDEVLFSLIADSYACVK